MNDLLSSQLADLMLAAGAVKTLLSIIKYLVPGKDPFTPRQVRVAALVLGEFCAFALKLGPLTLAPDASPVLVYANIVLGGVVAGALAMGGHETVELVKKDKP